MLDRTDREILRLLSNNARLSNKELAAAINLAPSSCLERVRHLREREILRGAHITVDPKALGIGLEALFLIELVKHSRKLVDNFLRDVLTIDEVRSAYLITGRYDFVVHVAVRDTSHLKNLALDKFTSRQEITRIETSIIYDYGTRATLPDYSERQTTPNRRRQSKVADSEPKRRTRSASMPPTLRT